ncbi:uncharacterized protein NP_2188A [Natronomonas pharaonis DSM 2160]|uniref:Uncharacterized protein n=1 Tax=Natronomonas pharaonis (strain ATCC 35678 / DSM 2160 / CIP 103997 / JCM 8858 / NBRC 14720 / NCIMB 2260 / Gabara) TaxID=348780 RepID=A0A1U7EVU9_NATPD|nr:DUF5799 family protein [Natronomonas pharaonis]CAI49185.1 uncharacterized protein NP_2188A [Natronomonas pharaonis DSM 2160]
MTDWQDMVVGDRMAVDSEFASRVDDSQFTRQEWGLIMTATTFEIRNPEDETAATIVADTSELEGMMPQIEEVSQMDPMSQQGGGSGSDGGVVDSILGALGLGDDGDTDQEKVQAAERLVAAYADELQAHLEAEGRWDDVRAAAAENE